MATVAFQTIDVRDLIQFKDSFRPAEITKATTRAINYALKQTRTVMKREVTSSYKLRSSDVGNKNIQIQTATYTKMVGYIFGDATAESIGHFSGVTEFRDVLGGKRGGGYIRTKKGAGGNFSSRRFGRNTSRSGVYFEVVKGQKQHFPGAFLVFFGTQPVVMARGKYQHSGQTRDFKFAAKNTHSQINKINTKSVYWGIMHHKTLNRWQPFTYERFIWEMNRQLDGAMKF